MDSSQERRRRGVLEVRVKSVCFTLLACSAIFLTTLVVEAWKQPERNGTKTRVDDTISEMITRTPRIRRAFVAFLCLNIIARGVILFLVWERGRLYKTSSVSGPSQDSNWLSDKVALLSILTCSGAEIAFGIISTDDDTSKHTLCAGIAFSCMLLAVVSMCFNIRESLLFVPKCLCYSFCLAGGVSALLFWINRNSETFAIHTAEYVLVCCLYLGIAMLVFGKPEVSCVYVDICPMYVGACAVSQAEDVPEESMAPIRPIRL
jgi:hypothetical protein